MFSAAGCLQPTETKPTLLLINYELDSPLSHKYAKYFFFTFNPNAVVPAVPESDLYPDSSSVCQHFFPQRVI